MNTPDTFADYARARIARNGIILDGAAAFHLADYRAGQITITHEAARWYVCGDHKTFWVFAAAVLWPNEHQRQAPRSLRVRHMVFPRHEFYTIEDIVSRSFTPVPAGHVTAYEARQWLQERGLAYV